MNDPSAESYAAPAPRILVVDADCALFGLLEEWLAGCGFGVECEGDGKQAPAPRSDLIVIDVAFPRHCGSDRLRRIASEHPGVPILALSSTFHAGVRCTGAVAQTLGVAGVLPKPVQRETLITEVRRLLKLT